MFPIPTPCKGKSKNQSFAHTFALTGRRCLCIDTQGVALGYELTALSGRSFSHFVRLSCAHALPLVVWQKNAQRFFCILNTLPFRALLFALCSFIMCACFAALLFGSKKNAQWLQILALVHPFSRRGVARHAPVASRTQAATSHFGTVGEATALKLLREETPKKRFEPMFYDVV